MNKRHGWCVREMYASANLKERKDGSWMKGAMSFLVHSFCFYFLLLKGGGERGFIYLFIYL